MMPKKTSRLLLLGLFTTLLSFSVMPRALADNPLYLSLGYQQAQLSLEQADFDGGGWYLDGQLPVSDRLSLVGEYNHVRFDSFNLTQWQLGGRFDQALTPDFTLGAEYRFVSQNLDAGALDATETGHQGGLDIAYGLRPFGHASSRSVLELGAAMTVYPSEDRPLFSVGYRAYLSRSFSLGLHLQQEADDHRWLTLTIREEK